MQCRRFLSTVRFGSTTPLFFKLIVILLVDCFYILVHFTPKIRLFSVDICSVDTVSVFCGHNPFWAKCEQVWVIVSEELWQGVNAVTQLPPLLLLLLFSAPLSLSVFHSTFHSSRSITLFLLLVGFVSIAFLASFCILLDPSLFLYHDKIIFLVWLESFHFGKTLPVLLQTLPPSLPHFDHQTDSSQKCGM